MNAFELHHGDCLDVLRSMPDNSVDSIVTDPPYGLSFMSRKWDYDVPSVDIWSECLRVLRPGGHLLAFAGTRTQHRMAVRIEDAGFEIRDMIAWVYGSGFPKHANALKPALEPITMARKPLRGSVAENVLAYGTGGLSIDGCRVGGNAGRWPANLLHDGSPEVVALFPQAKGQQGAVTGREPSRKTNNTFGAFAVRSASEPRGDTGSAARFFYQAQHDDSFPRKGCYNGECQDQNQAQSSARTAASNSSLQSLLDDTVQSAAAIWPSLAGILSSGATDLSTIATPSESRLINEAVTAAILPIAFESSRESLHEKHSPCGSRVSVAVTKSQTGTTTITASLFRSDGSAARAMSSITPTSLDLGGQVPRFKYAAKASKKDRGEGNNHVTVKPTELMRYLCRLVTPPGGVVLDPFMGSGSTGKAAVLEGFRFIGIEREAEYVEIARARIGGASG